MTTSKERQLALKDNLAERVLVLDGAIGTVIHQAPLSIETDYLMMEPEASVSAIAFHHPDYAYFTADEGEAVVV